MADPLFHRLGRALERLRWAHSAMLAPLLRSPPLRVAAEATHRWLWERQCAKPAIRPAPECAHELKHDGIYLNFVYIGFATFGSLMLSSAFENGAIRVLGFWLGACALAAMVLLPPPDERLWLGSVLCPQVASLQLIGAYIAQSEPAPPPRGFIAEPVGLSFGTLVAQLVMAMRHYPVFHRILIGTISTLIHCVTPVYSIGWREPALLFLGNGMGILCGLAINADEHQLRAALQVASIHRRADSRLYHVIKGQCGGANALLSGLLGIHAAVSGQSLSDESVALINQVQKMLENASEWCHTREVYVQLEAGIYVTSLIDTAVRAELESAVAGKLAVIDSIERVLVDRSLFRLLLREGLSNAGKYGQPGSAVHIAAQLVAGEGDGLSFLYLTITNTNRADVTPLTPSECKVAFSKKGPQASASALRSPTSSDGFGLPAVKLVTEFVGGEAWLSADEQCTTFHLKLPASTGREWRQNGVLAKWSSRQR